jgi:hypothetical protein
VELNLRMQNEVVAHSTMGWRTLEIFIDD